MTDATISKMETPTGQEETAILLEEQARRIATLQESLKQAGRIYPNEAVILQERDDLRRKLENAEMLIERLKREVKELDFSVALHDRNAALRTAEESSVVESGNQPEVITKLGKALQNTTVVKRVLVENSCPSEFGLEDCEFNPESGCTLCCEDCWNEEVEE